MTIEALFYTSTILLIMAVLFFVFNIWVVFGFFIGMVVMAMISSREYGKVEK